MQEPIPQTVRVAEKAPGRVERVVAKVKKLPDKIKKVIAYAKEKLNKPREALEVIEKGETKEEDKSLPVEAPQVIDEKKHLTAESTDAEAVDLISIESKPAETSSEKSDLEKWQKEQTNRIESTNNPLIKECREILASASIIEPKNFPREKQRLAIVTPVHREWNNGHIIDQLDSLMRQSVDKQTFSTVLVINNGTEAPAQTVSENKLTVDVVRYLARQLEEIPENPQISQAQREKLIEIRTSGLNVVGIDLTNGVKKHMGLIRSIGSIYALEKGLPSTENTYLSWMDADSQVEPQYCERVINHLSQNPEVNALYLPFVYYAEGDRRTFESSYRYRFDMTDRYFRTILFPTVEKGVGGPFMIGKASVWSDIIDNFPPDSERDEDFIASKRLFASGKVDFYPDTRVSTADRAYADGFDAKIRQEVMETDSARNEWVGLNIRIFGQLNSSFKFGTSPSKDQFIQMCQFCNVPYKEEILNRLAFEHSGSEIVRGQSVDLSVFRSIQNEYFTEVGVSITHNLQSYAESTRQFIEANLSETEKKQVEESITQEIMREDEQARKLREGISHYFKKIKSDDTTTTGIEDERINTRIPWVREEASKFNGSDAEFIQHLEQISPDVFVERSDNTQIRGANATLQGIMLFLYRARIGGPEKYPSTHRIWNTLTEGIK